MANMVAPRAHGVIARLTCSAFKSCNIHALTSAWPPASRRRREQARTQAARDRWFTGPARWRAASMAERADQDPICTPAMLGKFASGYLAGLTLGRPCR